MLTLMLMFTLVLMLMTAFCIVRFLWFIFICLFSFCFASFRFASFRSVPFRYVPVRSFVSFFFVSFRSVPFVFDSFGFMTAPTSLGLWRAVCYRGPAGKARGRPAPLAGFGGRKPRSQARQGRPQCEFHCFPFRRKTVTVILVVVALGGQFFLCQGLCKSRPLHWVAC